MDDSHTGLYVVMGVAGAGKSRIGAAFARALGADFVDGDDLHPPSNVTRMAASIALTDDDRREWLDAIAVRLTDAREAGSGLVVACSALKRAYRDRLRAAAAPAAPRFIHLSGSRVTIAERLAARRDHFMPETLLDSQFETLEIPAPDEDAWVCDVNASPDALLAALVRRTTA